MQDFIVNLKELLLTNGQLVDKMFAFCPIDPDRMDNKIHESSGISTNMTMLGTHFKILSNGKNPLRNRSNGVRPRKTRRSSMIPLCNFSLAMATGNDAEDLHLRIIHEWQRRGGILLRVKEI